MNVPGLGKTVLTVAFPVIFLVGPFGPEPRGPALETISPAPHSFSPLVQPPITARFDRPIDPAAIDDAVISVFGRWSGVVAGTVHIVEAGRELRFEPDRPPMKGEMVTASVSRQLTDADGQTMAAARDGDGDLDITGVDELDDMIFLFRNDKELTDDSWTRCSLVERPYRSGRMT